MEADLDAVRAQLGRDVDAGPASQMAGPGDGLGLPRDLAREAFHALEPQGMLAVQIGKAQWPRFLDELASIGYSPGGVEAGTVGEGVIGWVRAPG